MADQQKAKVDAFLKAGDSQLGKYYGQHWQDYRSGIGGMGSQAPAAAPQASGATREPPVPGAAIMHSKSTGKEYWKLPDGTLQEVK
jgi:hypothetical protein